MRVGAEGGPGGEGLAERAGAPRAAVLQVQGVGKRYGARVALHDVSFALYASELVALIGRNGAGKTTLLSVIAGVQGADEGRIESRAGAVGWVPQQPAIYTKLTVAENLRLWARMQGVPDARAAVETMLTQTGLRERADEQVGHLSGGNRQRVNIAVGLLSQPQVLLLDEPSAALDPLQRERLWEFVCTLAVSGTSVLFSTHNVAEAQRHAQRVLVLEEGRLLFDGPPDGLLADRGEQHGDYEDAFVAFLRERHG